MTTRITTDNITDGTITHSDLGSIVNLAVDWQAVIVADGSTTTTAEAGKGYFIDTTSAAHTINLPSSPSIGDSVVITDYKGTAITNNITIGRNGSNIESDASDFTMSSTRESLTLVYTDATVGWHRVMKIEGDKYISATGGTETTSGDYKIHSFTSSGCFSVSQASNQDHTVEYLVVAGGGGGGGPTSNWVTGGGGGGGHRTNYPSPDIDGFSITAQTYPITVGSGGTGNDTPSGDGSNSVFSTITSTGGGAGGKNDANGRPGGSGGGGGVSPGGYGRGQGNTPPVSPPQGNRGGEGKNAPGAGPNQPWGSGGGGGAGADGSSSSGTGAAGGSGTANSITGSSVTRAGGGGGGTHPGPAGYGPGGSGGGGRGAGNPGNAAAGSANTGGGGGGAGECSGQPGNIGQNGGSGIVILRYKYQN